MTRGMSSIDRILNHRDRRDMAINRSASLVKFDYASMTGGEFSAVKITAIWRGIIGSVARQAQPIADKSEIMPSVPQCT
jgi:hypothetical protein